MSGPPAKTEGRKEGTVQGILKKRTRKGQTEYLVRWADRTEHEETWEQAHNLPGCAELLSEFEKQLHICEEHTEGQSVSKLRVRDVRNPLTHSGPVTRSSQTAQGSQRSANLRDTPRVTRQSAARDALAQTAGESSEANEVPQPIAPVAPVAPMTPRAPMVLGGSKEGQEMEARVRSELAGEIENKLRIIRETLKAQQTLDPSLAAVPIDTEPDSIMRSQIIEESIPGEEIKEGKSSGPETGNETGRPKLKTSPKPKDNGADTEGNKNPGNGNKKAQEDEEETEGGVRGRGRKKRGTNSENGTGTGTGKGKGKGSGNGNGKKKGKKKEEKRDMVREQIEAELMTLRSERKKVALQRAKLKRKRAKMEPLEHEDSSADNSDSERGTRILGVRRGLTDDFEYAIQRNRSGYSPIVAYLSSKGMKSFLPGLLAEYLERRIVLRPDHPSLKPPPPPIPASTSISTPVPVPLTSNSTLKETTSSTGALTAGNPMAGAVTHSADDVASVLLQDNPLVIKTHPQFEEGQKLSEGNDYNSQHNINGKAVCASNGTKSGEVPVSDTTVNAEVSLSTAKLATPSACPV